MCRVQCLDCIPRQDLLRRYRRSSALLVSLFGDVASVARFPTRIAEYLAAARPAITVRIGEVATYLRDGETALAGRTVAGEAFDYALRARRLADAFSGGLQD